MTRFLASAILTDRIAVLRRVALSYWTPFITGAVMLVLHLAWAIQWEPKKRGEIVTGFGATMIVLGLLVAAVPLLRAGVFRTASRILPPPAGSYALPNQTLEQMKAEITAREDARNAAIFEIIAEKYVAVGVIVIGTLLNGYGPSLVRFFGWEA